MMPGERPEFDMRSCDPNQRSTNCQLAKEFILDCSRPQSASSVALDTPIQSPTNFTEMTKVPTMSPWQPYQPLTPEMTPNIQMPRFSAVAPQQLMQDMKTGLQVPEPRLVGRPRGPKFIWTTEQRALLEENYTRDHFNNAALSNFFEQKWGIPPKKVKCWFQNRRSKDRKKFKADQAAAGLEKDGVTTPEIVSSTDTTSQKPRRTRKLPPKYPYFPTSGFPPAYDQSYLHNIGTQGPVQFSVAPYYSHHPALMSRMNKTYCAPTFTNSPYSSQSSMVMNSVHVPMGQRQVNYMEKPHTGQFGGIIDPLKDSFLPASYPYSATGPRASFTSTAPLNLPQMKDATITPYNAAGYKGYQAPFRSDNATFNRPPCNEKPSYLETGNGKDVAKDTSTNDSLSHWDVVPVTSQCNSVPARPEDGYPPENSVMPENLSVKPRSPASTASTACNTSTSSSIDSGASILASCKDFNDPNIASPKHSAIEQLQMSSLASSRSLPSTMTTTSLSASTTTTSTTLGGIIASSGANCKLASSGNGQMVSCPPINPSFFPFHENAMYLATSSSAVCSDSFETNVAESNVCGNTSMSYASLPFNSNVYQGIPVNPFPAHTQRRMPLPSSMLPENDLRNAAWTESAPVDENNNVMITNFEMQADTARRVQMMSQLMMQMQYKHLVVPPKDESSPVNADNEETPVSPTSSLGGECGDTTFSDVDHD